MTLLALLDRIGRHARPILPAGLVLVALLPSSGGRLAPLVPWLVGALIAMTFTRIDLRPLSRDLARPRRALGLLAVLTLFQPVLAFVLSQAGHWLDLPQTVILVLVVFAAAPPLSSAPALALMLGYDATVALRLMLAGTLLSPLMVPVSFWLADLPGSLPLEMALRTGAMLAGGLILGLCARRAIGRDRIARQARALDGVAALLMLAFLLPLVDGLAARIVAMPQLAALLAGLACLLNFGGNLLMRGALGHRLPAPVAASFGLVFGNRNTSVILAAMPDPTIAFFVGLAQVPIYLTPALLGLYDRILARCSLSSES